MPNIITSPAYSFVNFNDPTLYCGDEAPFPLPAPLFGVGFQVGISQSTFDADVYRLGLCSEDCDLIVATDVWATELCAQYYWENFYSGAASWPTADKYPVIANTCYGQDNSIGEIPYSYATEAELLAAISDAIGYTLSDTEPFEVCCPVRTDFCIIIQDVDGAFYANTLLSNTTKMSFVDASLAISDNILPGQCFKYCVLFDNGIDPPDIKSCSQLFVRDDSDCYRTTIKYYGNDNQFDFVYRNDTYNLVRLPTYLRKPVFPTEERVFKKSDGTYRRQWAMVEKEWDAVTDYLPEWMHECLVIALKHDNVVVTSPDAGLTAETLTQLGSYDINWQEKEDIYAPANFKLRQPVTGMNRNCRPSSTCCFPGSITFGTDEIYFAVGSNATGVQVRYKLNTDEEWTTRDVEAATSPLAFDYMPVTICENTYWEVQLRTQCGGSYSPWSQTEIYRHPLACGYPVVDSVSIDNPSVGAYFIVITLTNNENIIDYSYEILNASSVNKGTGITPNNNILSDQLTIMGLSAGSPYTYTIDANCSDSSCTITGVINIQNNEVVSWTQAEV